MYKIVQWRQNLNLSTFYEKALAKQYMNNINQEVMVNQLKNENVWKGFVLYRDLDPIGFTSLHSIFDIDPKGYRILCRTALIESPERVISRDSVRKHKHLTSRYLAPACLNSVEGNCYISTNKSKVASQRLVHNIFMPIWKEMGIAEDVFKTNYRGHEQTFWLINKQAFLESLDETST
jgi:hypothetical protein